MKKSTLLLFLHLSCIFITTGVIGQIQQPLQVASESEVDIDTYTGILSDCYSNGMPSLWKNVENGKSTGLWLEWYPNGNLRYRAYWKNNKGHGKWEYFYPSGQLRSESFYIDDIAQGLYKSYHENGQLSLNTSYLNGKKDGIEITYDVDGLPLSRKRYEKGIQVIDQPLIFEEGNISVKSGNEWGINFMPDGNTAYFTRRDFKTGKKRIYISTKNKNSWSKPSIAPFSTHEDEGVFINKEGTKLYFASYRPLPRGKTTQEMDMNIWTMESTNGAWSTPKPLSNTINKSMGKGNAWPANYEAGPATDSDGNLYYWTKGSDSKGTNLYFSKLLPSGDYDFPQELLPPSSNAYYDTAPQLSPGGNILFFGSDNRVDGYGGSDIYYAVKSKDGWSSPKNLGPIVNSSQSEGSPSFSPDGKYFFFSSNRGTMKDAEGENIWNLYYIEARFLMINN